MDIGKAFTFVTEDENWIMKLVIGGIIMLIPIINFAGFGYMAELVRRVMNDDPDVLPEWGEFGQFFADGLKIFVGFLIYSLPMLLVLCVFVAIGMATGALGDNMNSDAASGALTIVILGLQCIMWVLALIPALLAPAIFARFAAEGTIGSMTRVGEVVGFATANLGSYIVVLLIAGVAMYVIAPLGVIACVVGVIFTGWWAYLVFAHLTGQLARQNSMLV